MATPTCYCDGPGHQWDSSWCGEGKDKTGKPIAVVPVILTGTILPGASAITSTSTSITRDDPIPRYAQLDLWMALGYDPSGYEAFREEHGYAETWSTLLLHVRLNAND